MENEQLKIKSEKLLKTLTSQFKEIKSMAEGGLDMALSIQNELIKGMTPKELAKKEAFDKKYISLIKAGKMKEAEELKKEYLHE
jgi:hypothetical protein